ncbi:MAG: DNA polymerase Y family protein [Hyphomicrobiaceae bacterium]
MSRIVSVWLPAWPIERLQCQSPGSMPGDRPAALVTTGPRGLTLSAVNARAAAAGILVGTSLADARAALPELFTQPAELAQDAKALQMLARWFGRYGPSCNSDGSDGVLVDVTGVAHLFGGERALCIDVVQRLQHLGVTARVGLADTIGAAHGLARFSAGLHLREAFAIAEEGGAQVVLGELPVAALRLDGQSLRLLQRLGLKRIGQLYGIPRSALAARFRDALKGRDRQGAQKGAASVLLRVDQALGLLAEPLRSLEPVPEASSRLDFPEPLITAEGLHQAVDALTRQLTDRLADQGLGARRFRLMIYRTDGTVGEVMIGTSTANRDPHHIQRLLEEKIASLDAGFGIDVVILEARDLARHDDRQVELGWREADGDEACVAALVDRLVNRLGRGRVLGFVAHASHIPELTGRWCPIVNTDGVQDAAPAFQRLPRPPLLLASPEPITVIAEVPEGAPQRFVWRRLARRIVRSEGPERIAPEWWRQLKVSDEAGLAGSQEASTRDYYRLEDTTGARYWVFRAGLYPDDERSDDGEPVTSEQEDAGPRWFMHGLFA